MYLLTNRKRKDCNPAAQAKKAKASSNGRTQVTKTFDTAKA